MNAKYLPAILLLTAVIMLAGTHVASARRAYISPVVQPTAPPIVAPIVSPS